MKVEEIKQLLQSGIVEFKYLKKSGEERRAVGTLNSLLIPKYRAEKVDELIQMSEILVTVGLNCLSGEYALLEKSGESFFKEEIRSAIDNVNKVIEVLLGKNKKSGTPLPENVVLYYDIKAQGFRRFDIDKLIYIERYIHLVE